MKTIVRKNHRACGEPVHRDAGAAARSAPPVRLPQHQATVSRDIKELQIVKSLDGMGGYRYCLPHRVEGERFGARFRVIFRECVTNIDYAQNIIVIKTMPGLGAAAGANIDSLKMPNMVGSLSGDDTTLVIMRDKESAAEFCRELHRMLE